MHPCLSYAPQNFRGFSLFSRKNMGTRTECTIMRVVDGDTLLVKIGDRKETLRLIGCDTEESHSKLKSKPNTNAGVLAAEFGKQYWWNNQPVIEFESDFPLEKCLQTERDWYDRLKCYVFRDDENYNLRLVQEGLSPYFRKYGSSQLYHERFEYAMMAAQDSKAGVWNPAIDGDGAGRNYVALIPWWNRRGCIADEFRVSGETGIIDGTQPCDNVCRQIRYTWTKALQNFSQLHNPQTQIQKPLLKTTSTNSNLLTTTGDDNDDSFIDMDEHGAMIVFCDLQAGVIKEFGSGGIARCGTRKSFLNLWIEQKDLIELIRSKYAGVGRGYSYLRGFPTIRHGVGQLAVIEICDRISDFQFLTRDSLPSVILREKIMQGVRYAIRRRREDASNQ